ncbi:MAG: ABC transporter ATP-binding protein, partial [Ureaplasma sp.]|nr:ABC transporter ATP-binding protein [Ureaplasma sp.]
MKLHTDNKNKKIPFISPNPEITAEYDNLISNNPDEFVRLFNEKRLKTTCISPEQEKFIKKIIKKQNKYATIQSLKTIWLFLKSYKLSLFWIIFVTIISVVLLCLASFGLQQLTQLLSGEQNTTSILNYGITLLVFYFISAAMMWFQTRIMAIVAQKIGYKIREQLFSKIQKLPVKYFDQNSSGDLMSKFINDVNNITDALSQNITIILNSVFTIIAMLLSMFLMSAYLSLITLAVVPFMFLPMMFVVKKSQPFFKQTQVMIGKVNGYVEEMISGQSVINLFDQSVNVSKEFKKINNELKKYARKSQAAMSIMFPYANFFSYFLIALITVVGIVFIDKGIDFAGIEIPQPVGYIAPSNGNIQLTLEQIEKIQRVTKGLSTLAIFSVMARAFLMPFAQIANVMNLIMAALAGASRAFAVFDEKDEINEFEHIVLSIAANSRTKKESVDINTILKNIDSEPSNE